MRGSRWRLSPGLARKLPGPKTQEGKAAVRLNAIRHGLRARSVLLPGEKPGEYSRLCSDLEADWQPRNRTEQLLVEQMAVSQWKLAGEIPSAAEPDPQFTYIMANQAEDTRPAMQPSMVMSSPAQPDSR